MMKPAAIAVDASDVRMNKMKNQIQKASGEPSIVANSEEDLPRVGNRICLPSNAKAISWRMKATPAAIGRQTRMSCQMLFVGFGTRRRSSEANFLAPNPTQVNHSTAATTTYDMYASQGLTLELSGHINRVAIDWSA